MNIETLSNCAPTLLADPMQLDAAALERSLAATKAAGFDGAGIWGFHVMFGGDDAARVVADCGLSIESIDAAISWADGPTDAALGEIEGLLALADQVDAPLIVATTLGPVADQSAAADGFAAIAARAADAGRTLALEFLPWTGVPTLAAANGIAGHADSPAGGILLDTWHWARQPGGPNLELLRSLPTDRIAYVQLSDATDSPTDDLNAEAMTGRLLPGAGVVDFAEIWSALDSIGASPLVAAEVLSTELVAEGPEEMARRVHDACRAVLP